MSQVAEWVLECWRSGHARTGVLLMAVPERHHAAMTEALHSRFGRLEPVPAPGDAADAAVRTLLDGGATLVCGGTNGSTGFQPSLFVHLRLSSALVEALEQPAPVLALASLEPESAAWEDLLRRDRCLRWEDASPDRP